MEKEKTIKDRGDTVISSSLFSEFFDGMSTQIEKIGFLTESGFNIAEPEMALIMISEQVKEARRLKEMYRAKMIEERGCQETDEKTAA